MPIFIKERLPKIDRDILTEASEPNLVTTTRNFDVRVFVKKPNNQVQPIGIKSSQMLKNLATRAVQVGSKVLVIKLLVTPIAYLSNKLNLSFLLVRNLFFVSRII